MIARAGWPASVVTTPLTAAFCRHGRWIHVIAPENARVPRVMALLQDLAFAVIPGGARMQGDRRRRCLLRVDAPDLRRLPRTPLRLFEQGGGQLVHEILTKVTPADQHVLDTEGVNILLTVDVAGGNQRRVDEWVARAQRVDS